MFYGNKKYCYTKKQLIFYGLNEFFSKFMIFIIRKMSRN